MYLFWPEAKQISVSGRWNSAENVAGLSTFEIVREDHVNAWDAPPDQIKAWVFLHISVLLLPASPSPPRTQDTLAKPDLDRVSNQSTRHNGSFTHESRGHGWRPDGYGTQVQHECRYQISSCACQGRMEADIQPADALHMEHRRPLHYLPLVACQWDAHTPSISLRHRSLDCRLRSHPKLLAPIWTMVCQEAGWSPQYVPPHAFIFILCFSEMRNISWDEFWWSCYWENAVFVVRTQSSWSQ